MQHILSCDGVVHKCASLGHVGCLIIAHVKMRFLWIHGSSNHNICINLGVYILVIRLHWLHGLHVERHELIGGRELVLADREVCSLSEHSLLGTFQIACWISRPGWSRWSPFWLRHLICLSIVSKLKLCLSKFKSSLLSFIEPILPISNLMLRKVTFGHGDIWRHRFTIVKVLLFLFLNHLWSVLFACLLIPLLLRIVLIVGRDVVRFTCAELEISSFKIVRRWTSVSSLAWLLQIQKVVSCSATRLKTSLASWVCLTWFAQLEVALAVHGNHFGFLFAADIATLHLALLLCLWNQILTIWLRWHPLGPTDYKMCFLLLHLLFKPLALWNIDILQVLSPLLHRLPMSCIIGMNKLQLFNWPFLFEQHCA